MPTSAAETLAPQLVAEFSRSLNDPSIDPLRVPRWSNKKYWWDCAAGHSFEAVAAKRSAGRGCPYCSGRAVLAGYNDLHTVSPELARQWCPARNDRSAAEVAAWSHYDAWWICDHGHPFQMKVAKRSRGLGCTVCAGYVVLPGVTDLATVAPSIAAELISADPKAIAAGGHTKRRWQCSEGHEWSASTKTRMAGHGCPYCAGVKVWQGFNDLASQLPELAAEWDYEANPKGPCSYTTGSKYRAHWTCKAGHRWRAAISSRASGRGCGKCALKGTSRTEQALYVALKEAAPCAQHRQRLALPGLLRTAEVDILIGHVVVEYDGSYFHNTDSARRRDAKKTEAMLANGLAVVRIRETNAVDLAPLDMEHPRLHQLSHRFGDPIPSLATEVLQAIKTIALGEESCRTP